jgi:hypothetical protein
MTSDFAPRNFAMPGAAADRGSPSMAGGFLNLELEHLA